MPECHSTSNVLKIWAFVLTGLLLTAVLLRKLYLRSVPHLFLPGKLPRYMPQMSCGSYQTT